LFHPFKIRRIMSSSDLGTSTIVTLTTVSSFRAWRRRAFENQETVGFVATMGALHDGHLSLREQCFECSPPSVCSNKLRASSVRRSLSENTHTVLSIFVNPAQFAPHEDLSSYPRTLSRDLELFSSLFTASRTSAVAFVPSVAEMYPSGIVLEKDQQKGTFVEVKGYDQEMEGKSRPHFFRGVATVVTKLFNIVQVRELALSPRARP
jgi:pantoate--beta-alanine ligase